MISKEVQQYLADMAGKLRGTRVALNVHMPNEKSPYLVVTDRYGDASKPIVIPSDLTVQFTSELERQLYDAVDGQSLRSRFNGGISEVMYIPREYIFEKPLTMNEVSLSIKPRINTAGIEELYMMLKGEQPEPKRVTAAQIHAELYAEVDTLLVQPEAFTEEAPVPSDRALTLKLMGFVNQPEVADFIKLEKAYQSRKKVFDETDKLYRRAMKYAMKYPNYKFITHEALEKVMSKYGLKKDLVTEFIGTIPDANVREMARFLEEVKLTGRDNVFNGFEIAAPENQFREKRRWNSAGFETGGFVNRTAWLLDDPIVLKPVRDGYLIVTAWGDEASDPDVVNERHN